MRREERILAPGVRLSAIRDERFKTGCLAVTLVTPLRRETAALNAILPYVLRRGTARHPETEALEAALDDLYGARIEPLVRKAGECQLLGFYADFADPAFVDEPMMLEKVTALLGELLLAPAFKSGRFRKETVATERENLLADIRAAINDKRLWANDRLLSVLCEGEAYGLPKLGRLREAERISVTTLTNRYHELLRTAKVELFACTSAPTERVERAFRRAFSMLPLSRTRQEPPTQVLLSPPRPFKRVEERMDTHETQLRVGYRLGAAMVNPYHPALLVMNALLGGCGTSKLYLHLREEQGLCYHTASYLDRHKGILLLSAGVEDQRAEEALDAMAREVESLRAGDFADWELDAARASVADSFAALEDAPGSLESYFLFADRMGMTLLPEELADLARTVSREDVLEAASGLQIDTVYLLRGEATHG